MRRTLRLGALGVLAVTACGSGETRPEEAAVLVTDTGSVMLVEDTLPLLARPGFLAARTVDPSQISGEWAATAGRCPEPRSVQIFADGDSVGVLIVIAPPDSGDSVVRYSVAVPNGQPPAAGTARMSVQRILYVGLAYVAASGVVQLSRLDRRVSGQFDVQLVDATSGRELWYVGSFSDLRFRAWSEGFCALQEPPDSAPTDSIR